MILPVTEVVAAAYVTHSTYLPSWIIQLGGILSVEALEGACISINLLKLNWLECTTNDTRSNTSDEKSNTIHSLRIAEWGTVRHRSWRLNALLRNIWQMLL